MVRTTLERKNIGPNERYFISHADWFGRKFSGTTLINELIARQLHSSDLTEKFERLVRSRPLVEVGCLDNPLVGMWRYNPSSITLIDPTLVEVTDTPDCQLNIHTKDVLTYIEEEQNVPRNAFCISTHALVDGIINSIYMRDFARDSYNLGWTHFHELDTLQNLRAFLDVGYKITGIYDAALNKVNGSKNPEDFVIEGELREYYERERPDRIPLKSRFSRFIFEM